ncbi:MAG: FAD-binding protein [Alphaproteobacteria bacterium]|jgi:2-octaprenyl-6-methoxyphenol hydroxylase|nr:FAD-binding protein [Alphaproteobacteria bacterium]MBT4710421.1 FAD-binding protein [Alphaproteobacteria bacterium]MBT5859809.1 FAD-binding protein [Alphaproteobacteria bacterium]
MEFPVETGEIPGFDTDVLVVGGGLVGQSLAIALAQAGVSVHVVDRAVPETTLAPEHDGRASAISFASQQMLRAIGVWNDIAESQPILGIRVTDRNSPLHIHFDHKGLGGEPFGAMVENRHMRLGLHTTLKRTTVRNTAPESLKSFVTNPFGVEATLESGDVVHARMLVAADGARSQTRDMAGIGTRGWSYDQWGIVTTVAHERPHEGIAHERFLNPGPFAILPLTGNRSSLVWTEAPAMAAEMVKLGDERFGEELRARFGDFLGEIRTIGPRWRYPLHLRLADSYVADRFALVGDAAHAMHPIAGQGLNLGLRDAAALAEVIVDAHRLGLDIASADVLARYERWRRLDGLTLLSVTDGLNKLFAPNSGPVAWARDFGLAAVNQMPPVKQFFVNHARGTVGKLPKLLRGEQIAP